MTDKIGTSGGCNLGQFMSAVVSAAADRYRKDVMSSEDRLTGSPERVEQQHHQVPQNTGSFRD